MTPAELYLESLAIRREWRRTRRIVWWALTGMAMGACALVWSGAILMGIGHPEVSYLGKYMIGIGAAMIVIGCQVDV